MDELKLLIMPEWMWFVGSICLVAAMFGNKWIITHVFAWTYLSALCFIITARMFFGGPDLDVKDTEDFFAIVGLGMSCSSLLLLILSERYPNGVINTRAAAFSLVLGVVLWAGAAYFGDTESPFRSWPDEEVSDVGTD